ncbi:MAG: Gldg family protein [Myxococcota bacterium]|nr:Gldg family protein [Myxococcota bacterium]
MTRNTIAWLSGMAFLFAGQRLYAGHDTLSSGLSFAGLGIVVAAIVLRALATRSETDENLKSAHLLALRFAILGLGAVGVYALGADKTTELLGLSEDLAGKWSVIASALWPILWTCSTLVLVAIDHAILASPRLVPPRRVKQASTAALLVGLGLALVFPINFIASEHNKRWDLTYFRTASPGDATLSLVENLNTPVKVTIFQEPSSEVAEELLAYFTVLEGPKLQLDVLDQASDPELSKELKIRDNGYVAVSGASLVEGEEEKTVTKSFKVGTDLDAAKRKLQTLDEDFHKILIEVAKGNRVAYLTTGHNEFSTKGGDNASEKLANLKQLLKAVGFKVKELGLKEGLGDEVPEDADIVMVVAPRAPFLASEADTLTRYLDRGGSLFVALEPDFGSSDLVEFDREDPFDDVLSALGVKAGEGVLASEASFYMESRRPRLQDRVNIFTTRFSSHASNTTLSKFARRGARLILPSAGHIEEIEGFSGKVTITARSLPDNWADIDGNLELSDGESKKVHPVAAASTGGEGDTAWRGIVIADATSLSDQWIPNPGNQLYVYDAVNWLIGEESTSGTLESEEDVKIQHTRDDQVAWFYGTIFGVPLLVFGGGALRLRRRRNRQGGAA